MSGEGSLRPDDTGRRRLIGALAYPAAALLSYVSYWVVAGVLLDGLLATATLTEDSWHVVAEMLFAVSGLLVAFLTSTRVCHGLGNSRFVQGPQIPLRACAEGR